MLAVRTCSLRQDNVTCQVDAVAAKSLTVQSESRSRTFTLHHHAPGHLSVSLTVNYYALPFSKENLGDFNASQLAVGSRSARAVIDTVAPASR